MLGVRAIPRTPLCHRTSRSLPARAPDKLISLEDAAGRLDVSARWLRENRPPYVIELSPKMLKVSEQRLITWLKRS